MVQLSEVGLLTETLFDIVIGKAGPDSYDLFLVYSVEDESKELALQLHDSFSMAQKISLAKKLANLVAYAHEIGTPLLHLDLQAIKVCPEGQLKLMPFPIDITKVE
jgi:hypothetical protein